MYRTSFDEVKPSWKKQRWYSTSEGEGTGEGSKPVKFLSIYGGKKYKGKIKNAKWDGLNMYVHTKNEDI